MDPEEMQAMLVTLEKRLVNLESQLPSAAVSQPSEKKLYAVTDDEPYATHEPEQHEDTDNHVFIFMDDSDIKRLLVETDGQISYWELEVITIDDYLSKPTANEGQAA